MLTAHKIDPTEYCVAIAQTHSQRPSRPVPNPASMGGEAGRQMWWWWRTLHAEKWTGVPDAVRAEVSACIVDDETRLRVNLRHAMQQCRHTGAREAVTFLWDPRVIWLLRLHEPAARSIIEELLAQPGSEYAPKMREALRAISTNQKQQLWLCKVWTRTIGPRRTLREHMVPDAVLAKQIALRELRHSAIAGRVAERRAQAKSEAASTIQWTMWSARQRQATRRVSS
jgi:hypothetical protein